MRIRTQCRDCGLPFPAVLTPETAELACPNCGKARPVAREGWSDGPEAKVDVCPLCGCRHLYGQKDVNRLLGCGLVVVGAILVPWTFGLSLVVFGLIDLWLYRRLKEAVVCYRCDTVYRDARPALRQGEFELLKHDVLKYGKTWEPTQGPSAASEEEEL
jgi:DNA-directed RNA polymerase subunit RPC12/RpoP